MARIVQTQGGLNGLVAAWFPNNVVADRPAFVVVVDIGQGNCSAVFSATGTHLTYYDIGGGVLGSQFTFPRPHPSYCVAAATKFILSHWDEDHYYSMYYVNQYHANHLTNTVWLAPEQRKDVLGGNEDWRLRIQKTPTAEGAEVWLTGEVGTFNIWPDEDPAHTAILDAENGNFRVIKVAGDNTNNHALALRVKRQGANEYFLLTGDAEYQHHSFDHQSDLECVGLVASHHGSAIRTPGEIPRPLPGTPSCRIAFSYGDGNQYCHPFQTGIAAYSGQGWTHEMRLDTAGTPVEHRFAGPRGNVGLMWPNDATSRCRVQALGGPAEIDDAAISLLAAAAAEIEVEQAALGQAPHIAVGAAYQGALEAGAGNVDNALLAPASAQTLAVTAEGVPPVAPVLANALGVVAAQAGNAADATRQALARTAVDAVLACWGRVSWIVAQTVEGSNAWQSGMAVQTRSSAAVKEARNAANRDDTKSTARAALTPSVCQALIHAAHARGRGVVPSLDNVRSDIAEAVCAGALAVIGEPGTLRKATPVATAVAAAGAMAASSDPVMAAIAAAVALAPMIPVGPNTASPGEATLNPHAAKLMRVGAVAALIGEENGASPADAAQAAAAAARVTFAAASGAHVVGCHRHPRTCANPVCSLSIHQVAGMLPGFITTYAGSGNAGAAGNNVVATAAELHTPRGLALDAERSLYIADAGAHVVRRVDAAGQLVTIAGTAGAGYGGDAVNGRLAAQFDSPTYALYVRAIDAVFVADCGNHVVRRVDVATGVVTTVAGDGHAGHRGDDGLAIAARLQNPSGLAYSQASNRLYVADAGNHCIRRIELSTGTVATVAGVPGTPGHAGDGGPAPRAELHTPRGIAVDANENIYIADSGNHAVRMVDNLGNMGTIVNTSFAAGNAGDGGKAELATLREPTDVAVNPLDQSEVFVVDYGNHCVRKVDAKDDIDTVAGVCNVPGDTGDGGLAGAARLRYPTGMVFDADGDYYIADSENHTLRQVTVATGVIERIAGTHGTAGDAGDAARGDACTLNDPRCPAMDGLGNLYIPVHASHRLRKLDTADGIDAWAGDGTQAYAGDAAELATAADLDGPADVAVDAANNILYIADANNHRIRKVDLCTGRISTIAGTGMAGNDGDGGPARTARLDNPSGVFHDPVRRTLFIADTGNHRIRKVELEWGTIEPVAGDGTQGFSGDGAAATNAQLHDPIGLAAAVKDDGSGALFIADSGNRRVRRVELATGVITTAVNVAGVNGHGGDGAAATFAQLDTPLSVALDGRGQLYIADAGNHRIRRVDLASGMIFTVVGNGIGVHAGDGGAPTLASISAPCGVVADLAGISVFVSDTASHRCRRACP